MPAINYEAPPTCARFMKADTFGRLIAGPVGSGKTTACLFELFRRACEQAPAEDGLRYTRFAIVRQTLKQLKDTVLKDIIAWLEGMAAYKVSDSTIYIEIGDVRSEWILIPLEDPEDQRRLLSMQLTGAWMSECIEMNIDLVAAISGRIPRYPSGKRGQASWFGIVADTNMPSEGSDWYKFMTEPPPDWQIFIQPGGLEELAENLDWLNQTPTTLQLPVGDSERRAQGRKYYERLARNTNPDWVVRYVHAKYGNDPSGTAVFRDSFRQRTQDGRNWHVASDLEPVSGYPILIGQDFGRDPWSIIGQMDHKGRLLILEEVEAEDVGLEQHLLRGLRPVLNQQRYLGRPIALVGDPAGKAKDSLYEETSFDVLKRHGFMAFPAPTNDVDTRIRAVEAFLLQGRDAGPAIVFDKERCPRLIQAMGGGYRFGKTKQGIRKPSPEKNEYSHPTDALQYLCLVAHGGMSGVITSRLRMVRPRQAAPPVGAWT